jgi:hypothetical protein
MANILRTGCHSERNSADIICWEMREYGVGVQESPLPEVIRAPGGIGDNDSLNILGHYSFHVTHVRKSMVVLRSSSSVNLPKMARLRHSHCTSSLKLRTEMSAIYLGQGCWRLFSLKVPFKYSGEIWGLFVEEGFRELVLGACRSDSNFDARIGIE